MSAYYRDLSSFYAPSIAKGLDPTFRMEHKGFRASLMRAPRLKGEITFGLPPGEPIPTYPIDTLPGCPGHWLRGAGNYVCPVDAEWGLWFSWTENDYLNTAILPSVKGMNPYTGQKISDLSLESYADNCPVHGTKFSEGRLCEKCGYRWPPQNYCSHPNILWLDGYRNQDGKVRQFCFSEDDSRDVASAVIGKENTVPAFGFAFFEPVVRRTPPPADSSYSGWPYSNMYLGGIHPVYDSTTIDNYSHYYDPPSFTYCCNSVGSSRSTIDSNVQQQLAQTALDPNATLVTHHAVKKDVSVAAGAEIRQDLTPDVLNVKEWKTEASGVICLYFVFKEEFEQIVRKGVRHLKGDPEGYLKGLPVG